MYVVENKNGEINTYLHMVKSAGISVHRALIESNKDLHVNQRHAHIRNLPYVYKECPKYMIIREPHEWYKSFYNFFLGVEGYLSFMLNDPKEDGYIYPISIDEFVRRSMNLKDTLIKYPNKARVFRNLLRSQGNMHFITGYFESNFSVDKPETMEQFNMSLYEWFFKNTGGESAILVPISRLDVIEDIFDIRIGHENKTKQNKKIYSLSNQSIQEVKNSHNRFYEAIASFSDEKIKKSRY